MRNSRKTSRIAAAAALAIGMLLAFAALGGVGLAQTNGGPGGKQYGKKKVTLCHKGKRTIRVAQPAVKAHLKHGDTLGTCAAAKAKKAKAAKAAKAKAAKAKAAKAKAEKSEQESNERSGKGGGKGKGKGKG